MKEVTDLLNDLDVNWKPKFPHGKPPIYEVFSKRKYDDKHSLIGEVTFGRWFGDPPFFRVVCYWTGDEPEMNKIYEALQKAYPEFKCSMESY